VVRRLWQRLFPRGPAYVAPRADAGVRIVVGLGNPGAKYAGTRHNVAWPVLDRLAERFGVQREEDRCEGVLARCGSLHLFKPLTYMNLTGRAVSALCAWGDVDLDRVLIVLDDLNLPLGALRLRARGSSGGHKGLESVIQALDTDEFPRLRMGIGPRPPEYGGRDFVLSRFAPAEAEAVSAMVEAAAEAVVAWAEQGIEPAMSRFNKTMANPQSPE